jgi:hypothetical protein
LSASDRRKIPLAPTKYQVLRVQCLDQDDLDSAELAQNLRPLLRDASRPLTRGTYSEQQRLVYVDAIAGDIPGAIIPQIRYTKLGNQIAALVRLNRDGKRLSEEKLEATLDSAVERILQSLIAQIERLPQPGMEK